MIALAILLSFASCAFADGSDRDALQSMDDETFIALWHDAQIEYMRRASHFSTLLGAGVYETGIDVPAGNYTLIPTGRSISPPGIIVFPDRKTYEQTTDERRPKGCLFSIESRCGERCDIALQEGNILVCSGFPVHCFRGSDFSAATDAALYLPPEGTVVPAGVYIAGQDIPVGRYTFNYNGKNAVVVEMYRDRELFEGQYAPTNYEIISFINPQVSFSLSDGYVLVIKYNSVIANKASQLSFD